MGCKTSKPVAVLPWDPNRNPSNNADAREKKGCEFSMEHASSRGAQVSKFEEHGIDVCVEEPQRERSEGPYDSPSRGYSNDPVYNASEPFGNAFYPRRNHSMPSLKERVQNDPSATDTRVRVDTKLQQCFGRTNTESPKCGSDGSLNGEQKSHQVSGSLIELDVSPNVYETIVNHCVFCKTRESRSKGYKLLRHHSLAEVSPRQYTSDACDLDKLPTCLCTECRQRIASRWRTSRHRTNTTSKGKKSQARSRLSPGKHAEQKKHSPPGKDHELDKSQAQRNQMEHRRRRRIDPERAKRLRHEAAGSFLKKGMKVSSYYEFSETIGKGRFGTIFKGINKVTEQQVALKRIDLATTQTEYVLAELQCLVSRHGSFVRLVELYEEGNYLWVVMELMRSELLSEVMNSGTFSETRAVDLVHVVARGLRFLHQNLYVHRDLKPENILIGYNDEFKLADFGLARQLKAYQDGSVESLSGTCGTWAYNAPEMRAQREKYGRSADIWALGVILFIVLSGYHPFDPDGKGEKESMLEAVVGNQWSFGDKCWRRVSGDAKDLISWMLARNPEDRPSPSEVLSHPWFAMSGANLNARFTRSEADATGNAAVQRYRASQTSSYHQSNNSGSACASPNPFGAHGRDYRPNFSAAIEEAEDLTA